MPDELQAAMLADFVSRIERLEQLGSDIAHRPIPALGDRTIADAMHAEDMWELVDRTLSRHEEPIQSQIIGFEAFLVDGLGPDRFVLLQHAPLGLRTSGPMPVGAQVEVIDGHSGLVLVDEQTRMPVIWRVEPGPDQVLAHGGFAAKLGDRVRLQLSSGDRVLSLDDLIEPVGIDSGPATAPYIAGFRASLLRNGTTNRRRVEFVGQPAEHLQSSEGSSTIEPDIGTPALEADLYQKMGASAALEVTSRWEGRSFFIDIGVSGLAASGSPILSVEFARQSVVLESVFPTPPALAKDLQQAHAAVALGDGQLFDLGTTELQQQVLEARLRFASGKPLPPQMLVLKHFAVHFADSQRAFQVVARSVQVHHHFDHNGG